MTPRPLSMIACIVFLTAVCSAPVLAQQPPSSQPTAKTPEFTEEPITVSAGKYELPGALTLPNGSQRVPVVVMVHGSGPHDMDETIGPIKVFKDIAEGLAKRGVAAIRYEKRTKAYPLSVKPEKITLDWEVNDDALAAVRQAREQSRIDPRRVFVLGHSLGATCAPIIGSRDKEIAGLILLSGTPRSLLDLIDEQLEYIAGVDGKVSEKERKNLDDVHKTTQLIREGKYDEVKSPLMGAPTAYWAALHKLDVLTPARSFGRPILVIGGGRDYQVTEKCFNAWKKGLEGVSNITYKWYEKNNHLMVAGEGTPSPDEYFKPGHVSKKTIKDIAEWVNSVK